MSDAVFYTPSPSPNGKGALAPGKLSKSAAEGECTPTGGASSAWKWRFSFGSLCEHHFPGVA